MLRDFGERRILHEIIEKFFPMYPSALVPIGDDAAVVAMPDSDKALVLTTDPCPIPVAWLLGERDYYLFGWYSVLINASDLAAMGATPTGILLAVNAREDMLLDDFQRFLTGVADAAKEFNCPVLGGNLKDANEFSCIGTAVGTCYQDRILQRSGAKAGDIVLVIGDMGLLASGVLSKLHNITLSEYENSKVEQALMRPKARVTEGMYLSAEKLANSCIDSSDGLSNCFYEIALKSKVDIFLDINNLQHESVIDKVADKTGIDFRKLLLMWGDWQLVSTIPKNNIDRVLSTLSDMKTPYSIVGEVKEGTGKVLFKDMGRYSKLFKFDNERFSKTSYYSKDLRQVFDLNNTPLTE